MLKRALGAILVLIVGCVANGSIAPEAAWSYEDLDHVLERFVEPDGRVDYAGLKIERAALDRFVAALGRTSPDSRPELFATDAERLVYWMNAYNALMLRRVVDAWPIESVREIKPAYGVFWMERHTLGGDRWTLRALENKVIRERFGEPRIHFAINCASTGCPALPRRAWRPETLEADLDAAARRFVADPGKVRIDRATGTIHLSKIFEWFRDDFTDWLADRGLEHTNGVTDYVLRHLPERQREGPEPGRLRIEWIEYDWSINAAPAARSSVKNPG